MQRIVIAVLACVAAVAFAPAAAWAADTCPNAAYRAGAGANLPDCRAWEQATPVDKGGAQPDPQLGAYPGPDGNRVLSIAPGNIGGAQSVSYLSVFASTRGSAAWNTIGVDAVLDSRPTNFFDLIAYPTVGFSDDRTKALVASLQKLTPEATKGDTNLYVRNTATGAYTWVATEPGSALYTNLLGIEESPHFFAANPSFTHIAFTSQLPLEPDAIDDNSNANLYLISDGKIRLQNRDESGVVMRVNRQLNGGSGPQLISDDGSRVTFVTPLGIYQRVNSTTTTLLSRSHRPEDNPPTPVASGPSGDFAAWPSPDGSSGIMNVEGTQTLTEDNIPSAFYRWSNNGDDLQNLLAGVSQPWSSSARDFALLRVSPDERYLWFLLTDQDRNGDPIGELAVLDTQAKRISIKAAAKVPGSTSLFGSFNVRSSPDRTKLVARTIFPLTNYDQTTSGCANAPCLEAYAFDATQPEASPVCISCGPAGTSSVGDAGIGNFIEGRPYGTVVTNDGRVFFDTPQRLVAGDVNDQADVYQYTPGQPSHLISSGTGSTPATVSGISSSGDDVFFLSADKLVPQDSDGANDIYDARVNGGLAAQQIRFSDASPCPSGSCRGAPAPAPVPETPGTSLLRGPASAPVFSVSRVSSSARRAAASTGRLRVAVKVGAPGRLAARASARVGKRSVTLGRASVSARKAGRLTLTIGLSKTARRALARERRLTVALSVSYSQASKPATQSFTLVATRARSSKKGGAR